MLLKGNDIQLSLLSGTRVYISLVPDFKSKVEGLCGDFNGNSEDDFYNTGNYIAGNSQEFGNSWAVSGACPQVDVGSSELFDPCEVTALLFMFSIKLVHVLVQPKAYFLNIILLYY